MKRRLLFSSAALMLAVTMAVPVMADDVQNVIDKADVLTDAQEQSLEKKLDEIDSKYDMTISVVTVDEVEADAVEKLADEYMDNYGIDIDGILFLVSKNDKFSMTASGYGITAFTDAGRDYIVDQMRDDLKADKYDKAFDKFADQCDDFIKHAKDGKPYDKGNMPKGPFPFARTLRNSLIIGFIIALIANLSMKSKLKSVVGKHNAANYIVDGSLNMTVSTETFLYKKLEKVKKNNETKDNSGGSTTHTTEAGSTHSSTSGSL